MNIWKSHNLVIMCKQCAIVVAKCMCL